MQTSAPVYIVFQVYGNESVLHECIFALLSLSKWYTAEELKDIQVWIYTDKPDFFKSFKDCPVALHYRIIDPALIKKWRGAIDFVHRVKIEVLKDFTNDKQGSILYLDTDVVFLQRIDKLFEDIGKGKLFMHVDEGRIKDEANPVLKKLHRFIQSNTVKSAKGEPITVPGDTMMWNAGVLGFRAGNMPLDAILHFTDSAYAQFPKHIVEQFAFSLFLQEKGVIHAAAPYILHYWNLKELRPVLASFFDYFKTCSWNELVHYSQLIQVHVLIQQKANFYENRSLSGKIKKARWYAAIPDWESIIQQL